MATQSNNINTAFNLNLPLQTDQRLLIRQLSHNDAEAYFSIFGDPVICRYDDFKPITQNDAFEDLKVIIEAYENVDDHIELAVEDVARGIIVGILYVRRAEGKAFIGYHFNQKEHGKGFALESLRSLLKQLSGVFGTQVFALVHPENESSIRLLNKLGFKLIDKSNHLVDSSESSEPENLYQVGN